MNSPFLPTRAEQVFDLRAATMHDDDIETDQFEQHDVAAKQFFRCSSVIALPPYLTTMVLPWKRLM